MWLNKVVLNCIQLNLCMIYLISVIYSFVCFCAVWKCKTQNLHNRTKNRILTDVY